MMPPGMICGMEKDLTAQEKVNQEWDAMAGEWDDLAGGYAKGFYKILWNETGMDPADLQAAVMVDFGCGSGLLTDKLRTVASQVLAIDASTKMIDLLQEKILTRDWQNVQAAVVQLANLGSVAAEGESGARKLVEDMQGRADLVVASSVLTFIPAEDAEATMSGIGRMLKPGGIFCHSDWPKSEARHPDAMTEEKAVIYFGMAGLETVSTRIVKMRMGDGKEIEVFVGVAKKP